MIFSQTDFILMIVAYFLGSIPFGLIVAKTQKIDIRTQGSGNIGATNVTRVIGKKLGALVLILDGLKGVAAILLAKSLGLSSQIIMICAALAVLGHIFPIWLKFKGGKGVSTTIAALLTLNPLVGIATILTWLISFKIFKISSLSALIAMAFSPLWAMLVTFLLEETVGLELVYLCSFLAIIVIACHHENISRMLKGKEKTIKG